MIHKARRAAKAAALTLAACATPALAIDIYDPAIMARQIFALYGKDGRGFDLSGRDAPKVIAPGLLELIRADEKAAKGEVGALGGDPFCSCQDYDITAVQVASKSAGPDKADVSVAHRNFGKPQTVILTLVATADGWRIADIGNGSAPSVLTLLHKAAKAPA